MRLIDVRRSAIVAVLLAASVLNGCGDRGAGSPSGAGSVRPQATRPHAYDGTARQLLRSEMSNAEIKYGIAPVPNAAVTYQPDVVVVGGGPDVIHSQSSSGFIWTIDATAPHADELAEGKVFFLTNRAVGRVLELRRSANELVVVLGPVDLTEIVREAHIHIPATPIDLGEAIPYVLPEVPGQQIHIADAGAAAGSPFLAGNWLQPSTSDWSTDARFLRISEQADVSGKVKFKVTPIMDKSGVGMRAVSNGGGLTMSTEVRLSVAKPSIALDLDISNGLKKVMLELHGASGLIWKFDAGNQNQVEALVNTHDLLVPDTDFVINLIKDAATAALPLSATFRQRFSVNTALGTRKSTLRATGNYAFKGGFKVGYEGGQWTAAGPTSFTANKSLVESTDGTSLAITAMNLGHVLRLIAGVGVAGFTAGPYVDFGSSIGVERNSDAGMLPCSAATLVINLGGGAGYSIPSSITQAINYILKLFGSTKQIAGYGGLAIVKPTNLINTAGNRGGCAPSMTTETKS